MKLYEIDREIERMINGAGINNETGEIEIDYEKFNELQIEKEEKYRNLIGFYHNIASDIGGLDNEINRLRVIKQKLQTKREGIKRFLALKHEGQKAKYGIFNISWRKSTKLIEGRIEVLKDGMIEMIRNPRKEVIKEAIKNGVDVPGWKLEESQNIQIK